MADRIIGMVGAGGKTTAMGVLARQCGAGVLVTTTTHIYPMDAQACRLCLQDPPAPQLLQALARGGIVCAGSSAREGKLGPLPLSVLQQALEQTGTVLYEGDGSRGLPLKLHREDEPVLLPETTRCLLVAGLAALHRPVCEAVHRYSLHPLWQQQPHRPVGEEELLYCILETARKTGLPCCKLRVFLNHNEGTCPGPEARAVLDRLKDLGLPARLGSLWSPPEDLFQWVTAELKNNEEL